MMRSQRRIGNRNYSVHPGSFVRTKAKVEVVTAEVVARGLRALRLQRLRLSYRRGEMSVADAMRLTQPYELAFVLGQGSDFQSPPTRPQEAV